MLEMAGHRTGDIVTEKDVLDMVSRQRDSEPQAGRGVRLHEHGYLLLAVVVRRVSGRPLREFADANIFKPLGMSDTSFSEDHSAVIPRWSKGICRRAAAA